MASGSINFSAWQPGIPRVIVRDMVEKEQSSERLWHTSLCTPSGRSLTLLDLDSSIWT